MKGGALVRVKMVMSQLATSHSTNGMDKIYAVEIFESVLIRIMGVGPMVEVKRGRVLNPILIMSILWKQLAHGTGNRN